MPLRNDEYLASIEVIWERTVAPNKADVFDETGRVLAEKDKEREEAVAEAYKRGYIEGELAYVEKLAKALVPARKLFN